MAEILYIDYLDIQARIHCTHGDLVSTKDGHLVSTTDGHLVSTMGSYLQMP